MTEQTVTQKPSETAMFAALRRYLAHQKFQDDKLGPDHLAGSFLPPHFRFFLRFERVRENTWSRLDQALPGLSEFMIARTAYFDEKFLTALQKQVSQIVLLGAGYDTRAFRFANSNKGTRIIELDIAPTQERKAACIKKARLSLPTELTLSSIDFNRDDLLDVLRNAGWQQSDHTLFIWEGVSYYLEPEAVLNTLQFFNGQAAAGSTLVFDYSIKLTDENIDNYYGAASFQKTMAEHHSGEKLLFSIPEEELSSFIDQQGLSLIENLNQEQIENKYLTNAEGVLIGRMTGNFRFAAVESPE
jgi:methyltransferase (TIGR00027 family)